MDLTNKKVVVIGGSSEIGLAIAQANAAANAKVVISSRSPKKLEEALEAVPQQNVMVYSIDLTQEDSVA
ncbi:MAG: SDR family NAD(P)-dependent oxidoreductase [Thermosynechococcaceae cyanobacterium]